MTQCGVGSTESWVGSDVAMTASISVGMECEKELQTCPSSRGQSVGGSREGVKGPWGRAGLTKAIS